MTRRRLLVCFLQAMALLLSACSPAPLRRSEMQEPELRTIHAAFQEAIDKAKQDGEATWHNGWLGNVLVNLSGGDNLGLCYHWQEWTYQTMYPAVRSTGWELCGIAINVGWSSEHHSVLIWDPRRVARADLLNPSGIAAGYVLDAWRRGAADIYRLEDWLDLPLLTCAPASIEDLSELEAGNAEGSAGLEAHSGEIRKPDSGR